MLRIIFGILILSSVTLQAEVQARIRILGRDQALITTDNLRLSDLASVSSNNASDDEIVIGLQKINLGLNLQPGETAQLSAEQILQRIKEQGVDLSQVGYSFASSCTIKRAARPIENQELLKILSEHLSSSERDLAIKKLHYTEPILIAPGDVTYQIRQFGTSQPSRIGFKVNAISTGGAQKQFEVEADIEEWKEVTVASRSLQRGELVGEPDIQRARMNLAALRGTALLEPADVLGMEVSRSIGVGEVFSNAKLVIPPVIENGARVSMVFKGTLFEATASGIAMQSAAAGQLLKVKNESSKKIVNAIAIESGLVEVRP